MTERGVKSRPPDKLKGDFYFMPYKKQTEKTSPARIKQTLYDRLEKYVLAKHGQKYGYFLDHLNKALEEYLDKVEKENTQHG